jgi:hypothetical protein
LDKVGFVARSSETKEEEKGFASDPPASDIR